jgi:hypothetical protein
MPTIDVQVVRGRRPIGVARSRPLRVTPLGYAGVVYKGRVHEVRVDPGTGYFIDAASESWSEALTICPFAPHREVRGLLKRLRKADDVADGAATDPSVEGEADSRAWTEAGEGGGNVEASTSESSIEQIFDLLMPQSRASKAG